MSDRYELINPDDYEKYPVNMSAGGTDSGNNMANIFADAANVGKLFDLVNNLVEIQKIQTQGEKDIREIEAKTEAIKEEAKAYKIRLEAEADCFKDKSQIMFRLLEDFNRYKKDCGMTIDEFVGIIQPVLENM